MTVPLEERGGCLWDWWCGWFLVRRLRMQRRPRRASAAPKSVPGKKPATTAWLGKEEQVSVWAGWGVGVVVRPWGVWVVDGGVVVVEVGRVVDVVVVSWVAVDVVEEVEERADVAVTAVLLFNAQVPS